MQLKVASAELQCSKNAERPFSWAFFDYITPSKLAKWLELTFLDLVPLSLASYKCLFWLALWLVPMWLSPLDVLFPRTLPQSWACVSLHHLLALCCPTLAGASVSVHWTMHCCCWASFVFICFWNQQHAVTDAQLLRSCQSVALTTCRAWAEVKNCIIFHCGLEARNSLAV